MLEEFRHFIPHWSLGLTILISSAASQNPPENTILAIFLALIASSMSALSSQCISNKPDKTRKFYNVLIFLQIWFKILELLTVSATCARIASATFDFISKDKFREWLFGLESDFSSEPWPDIIGVFMIAIVCALMMLGLEQSSTLSSILAIMFFATFTIFIALGIALHMTPSIDLFEKGGSNISFSNVISVATLCCYGFVNTLPENKSYKVTKTLAVMLLPILLYIPAFFIIISSVSFDESNEISTTPLLEIFELRHVSWAEVLIYPGLLCTVSLVLTETLENLCDLFVTLATPDWSVFLTSLQYRNNGTGAPILAIFASGSLAAILAFACPLEYLLKILPTATLSKCIVKSCLVLLIQHNNDVENTQFRSSTIFGSVQNVIYNKLPSSDDPESAELEKRPCQNFTKALAGLFSEKAIRSKQVKRKPIKGTKLKSNQRDEYLLLDDYCDNSVEYKPENDRKISKSSDEHSESDIDLIVEEYKEKNQISTENYKENHLSSYVSSSVLILVAIIITATLWVAQILLKDTTSISVWLFLAVIFINSLLVIILPKNQEYQTSISLISSSRCITTFCLISLELNLLLISTAIPDIWPGFTFWLGAGCLLYWRCECCTCDGLENTPKNDELHIVENMESYENCDSDDDMTM